MKITSFFRKTYFPLNKIEIFASALLHNYYYLASLAPGIAVAPVLKSNAYGHGLVEVARILDGVGAPFFCVDSLYEAYALLKHNIKTPILIMGYVNPDNLKVKKLPFSYAVSDTALALAITHYQPHAGIHLFVDTGMHREGISLEDLPEFLAYIKNLPLPPLGKGGLRRTGDLRKGVRIEGLMSHLAAVDQVENPFTQKQIRNFEKAQRIVEEAGFSSRWRHLGASGGLLHHNDYRGQIGNLARVGIALYGIDPEGKEKNLLPVLQLTSTLTQVKRVGKGEKIGYDFTATAKKDMTIGILPLGYHDGIDRRLSNKGFVSIKNTGCPIIGRVSMNLTTIDLSGVADPQIGETVMVYSNTLSEKNSISNATKICDAIPYDLLVHLTASTKRVVV